MNKSIAKRTSKLANRNFTQKEKQQFVKKGFESTKKEHCRHGAVKTGPNKEQILNKSLMDR